jgi:hypothetical protein
MLAGSRTRARKRAGRSPGRYSAEEQKSAKARGRGIRRLARFFRGAAARARAAGNGAMPRKAGRSKPAAGLRCRRRPLRPRAVKQRSRAQPRANRHAINRIRSVERSQAPHGIHVDSEGGCCRAPLHAQSGLVRVIGPLPGRPVSVHPSSSCPESCPGSVHGNFTLLCGSRRARPPCASRGTRRSGPGSRGCERAQRRVYSWCMRAGGGGVGGGFA